MVGIRARWGGTRPGAISIKLGTLSINRDDRDDHVYSSLLVFFHLCIVLKTNFVAPGIPVQGVQLQNSGIKGIDAYKSA